MAIVAECPACGKRFKAAETQAGKKAKCSQCSTVFVIGGAGAPAEPTPAAEIKTAVAVAPQRATVKPAPQATPKPAPVVAKPATKVIATTVRTPRDDISSSADLLPTEPAIIAAPVTAPGKRRGKLLALVATLAIAGGAAAIVVPKLLHPTPANSGAGSNAGAVANNNDNTGAPNTAGATTGAQVATLVISPALPPSGPAWSTRADEPAPTLKLPDDFSLKVPAHVPLRHDPGSLVLAPAPSPSAAIMLLPDADHTQVPIEVWNLTHSDGPIARFKLSQLLAFPVLSQNGGYYAGQYYDSNARANRVEVWSTSNGTRAHAIDIPGAAALPARTVLGFPLEDQVTVYGERLQVWDLNSKSVVREVGLPPRGDDTRVAASSKLRLVAVADSRQLTMVDMGEAKALGTATIPEAVLAHPRKRLALRAIEFSPDGAELALAFDNRLSTRRIAVYDVATGTLKALHTPAAPIQVGGPELRWLGDSRGFMVGGGILLDRATGRQVGQVYGDLAEEGLGGVLNGPVGDDQALVLWDKYPNSLTVRAVPLRRERPQWVNVELAPATASLFKQLQCVSSEFGNYARAGQSMLQTGQMTDGRQFLVVNLSFTASLAPDAPAMLPFRQDQFVLVADGRPLLPIGTLARDGAFSLEKPEYDLHKGPATTRKRAVVFAVTGAEKSLALRVGPAEQPLDMPATSGAPTPGLAPMNSERLAAELFTAPDDAGMVSARVVSARVRPYELEPDAADHVPLRITYSGVTDVLAVTFELTVNSTRRMSRGADPAPPRLGLLLADGTHLRPAVELPGLLPQTLGVGERRTHTCLFLVSAPASRMRLTYDNVPVATVTPDAATAQNTNP